MPKYSITSPCLLFCFTIFFFTLLVWITPLRAESPPTMTVELDGSRLVALSLRAPAKKRSSRARIVIARSINDSPNYTTLIKIKVRRGTAVTLVDQLNLNVSSVGYRSRVIGRTYSKWSEALYIYLPQDNANQEITGDDSEIPNIIMATPTPAPTIAPKIPGLPKGMSLCPPSQILQTLNLINAARSANGVAILTENALLEIAALNSTIKMASSDNLSHEGWSEFILQSGYQWRSLGQNIGYTSNLSAPLMVQTWLNSPSHRSNILAAKFVDSGISCLIDKHGGIWWAQDFGS